MKRDLFAGLNPEQKRAIETTEGPLLIQAGAGSGKTKTLTHRIAYIISSGLAAPYEILAVTFTNKAAKEMRVRLARLVEHDEEDRSFLPFMGTFHSICVKLLRADGDHIKIPKNFVIFDEADRLSAVKQVCKILKVDEKSYPARAIAGLISSAKNELVTPDEYANFASSPLQNVTADVFPLYEKVLKDASALDFDDLIGKAVKLFAEHKEVREKWQRRFKYIMIDEYQDTNSAQYKLVKLLVNQDENIAVVGDDWQSIYSWRGADFRNILNFEKDYKNVCVIKLEQNYRSTSHILEAAHKVISKNIQRSDKKLWTASQSGLPVQVIPVASERAEAEAIIQRINIAVNSGSREYDDFAVLYRTNAQSRALEESFMRYGVPYRIVGGVKFYERKEIRDVIAYVRLIFQPEDRISFERIANVPARGFGAKSLSNFFTWQSDNNLPLEKALARVRECDSLTPKARSALSDLNDTLAGLREIAPETTPAGLIESLLRRTEYIEYLNDGTVQAEARIENVNELLSVARVYQDAGLEDFLEEVSLVSDAETEENRQSQSSVTFMTLHSAKGLEFPVVFMVGLEETMLPHTRAQFDAHDMEEERRLCYVGMTRAKEELYMLYAGSRVLYGGIQHNIPSRFLSEIDGKLSSPASPLAEESFSGQTSASMEPRYVEELHPGDKVRHQVFGVGTVMDIQDDVAIIDFKSKGSKKLNTSFAPIERL
ncbi:MAG TPA: UvrD-helicase domain-containing protein [Candidatus Saccharimonadales bacterium]|nr:UvrD-helicase domain-containing protein [Candidatus Saccharimonadales bacterium]